MNKKRLTVLSAICFFLAAALLFVVVKNTALGICCALLCVASLVRIFVMNKKNNNEIQK